MKKKILLAIILVAAFFMCISLIFENNETYSIYRETLNTKVYLSVINSSNQIKIEFDAQGGESVPDTYREYNQEIGALPVTEQTGYNFIGWYTERDGGTKVHPSDVITAPVTYYAHWAKLVCKKAAANTLHQETCDTNGGCTKLTGEFAYELGDPITYGTPAGTGIPVTGNAYDCDVDNNGVFDPVHERFYYIRANVGDDYQNAVLVHYTSFDAAGQMDSSSSRGSYQFEAGKAYLPDSTTWSNPSLISFDTKVSRYINHTDIEEACGEPIIYNNVNYLGRCQYLLENSRFQAKASGRAGIWVDKIPGSDTLYRIQSESMSIQVPDKVTSENTVRPVIEIPFNTIDGFKERESFNVTFDSVGGTHVPSEARYDGEEIGTLPTTTKDGLTFGGWYTDTTYQTEVTSSTVITSTTTFYAKWIKPLDDLKYLFYIPGSCTFGGSSTVNITSSTNDCISIVNPTDTPIDYTATANKYINTGVKLYITENKSKDYEIGFTLVNYDSSIQMRQATIMNTKLESTGYPGLVFRRFDETDKLDLSSRTTSSANTQLQIPSDGVEDVKIYRIYNEETEVQEIFYSINNGEKIKVNDLSQNNPTFNTDVWFGATPKDANANTAQRYFKGTLSNMYIKIKDNSITKNTVTFNTHGGESDYIEKEVQQGSVVGNLPNASKPGYEFDGWYTAETGGTKITSSTVVNSDITYHAHWAEKYIVSFNANSDGDDVTISQSSFEVIKNGSIGAENLPTATRDGYEFDGWYTDPDNGTQITGNEVITNDTDYYAHWVLSSTPTTVTYNLSSDNMNTWQKNHPETINVSYDSTTHMSTVVVNGVNGKWEQLYIGLTTEAGKEYTFTFDYQNPYGYQEYSTYGGIGVQAIRSNPSGDNETYEINRINLPSEQNTTTVSKTLTFTARGTTTYITFNFGMAEDGTTTTILLGNFKLVETLNKGNTLDTSVTSIAKSGYTFDGYYTLPTNGTQVTSSTKVPNQDTTYYAHWTRSANSLVKTVTPESYVYDGTTKTPAITVSDGNNILTEGTDYIVTGNSNTNVGTHEVTINIANSYVEGIQANYGGSTTVNYYINNAKLTFDKGSCTSTSGTTTLYAKKDETSVYTGIRNTTVGTIPTASKSGYTFNGWYDSNNNKILNIDGTFAGTSVVNYTNGTTWQTVADQTLYAICESIDTYTLTANANGGSISSTTGWTGTGNTATKQVTHNATYGTLPNVSKSGHALIGWSLLPEGYTQVEYIESTGTQWINTGAQIFNKENHELVFDFEPTQFYNYNQLFGSTYDDNTFESWIYSDGKLSGRYNYKDYGSTNTLTLNTRYLVNYVKDGSTLYKYVNDTLISNSSTNVSTSTTTATLTLFKSGLDYSKFKLYSFKIYANGEILRNYIPCIENSTGKAGLYDIENNVFYDNDATTGNDFTTGNQVPYITSTSIVDVVGEHTIYAIWNDNVTEYNITYGLNNGIVSESNPLTYNEYSDPITLNNPTKSLTFVGNPNATVEANAANGDVTIGNNTTQAQTFAGWTGSNGTTAQTTVTISTGSTGDKSYTAHWTAVAGTLPTVTRIGYVCGWSTSSTGTTIEYASGGTFPTSAINEDMAATVNLYAVCNQADYTAMIGNTGYDTVQEAINAVPENGSTPTTIVVLKDLTNQVVTGTVPFAYIAGGRNIYMDLQGHTISVLGTNNPKTVHIYNGYLELTNGTITTAATQGTIEISSTGTFKVNNATIANTSSKAQAIFNNGGTVYIEEGSVITNKTIASGGNRRAAVHNYGTGGAIYITGGTITSTNFAGVYNERGSLTIGTQGGGVSTTSPTIQGKTYGVTAVATYKFYDGILKGETGAVAVATSAGGYSPPSSETIDTGETKISEYEANTTKVNDVDGNYKVLYLQSNTSDYTITLNPNGGSIGNISNTITVTPGSEVGSLPIPTKGIYTFDGWFDEDTDEEVDDTTTPTKSTTYYAKWIYQANPNVVEFRTTPDAQKVYYQNIDTWKTSASNFPSWNSNNKESNNFALDATENTVMKNNFDNNNCMCADNQCTSSGTVHCDKPKGYNTGAGEQVNVYTYNTSTSTKETLVTYAKGSDGIIYNLIPNKVYYWELDSDITVHGLVKFIGERRILDAGDVLNARDLGGLPVDTDNDGTIDGHLKYGKLIRGIKLNSANSVTELTNLGLTKEIDLREANSDTNKLPNYQRVEAQNYYIKHNSTNTTEQQYYAMTRAAVKQIMLDITNSTDPQNIYFHCRIGTDRTGTVAYILEGLLGVPEEDRVQDYELSFFYGLIRIHRYHNEKPGSSIGTGKERFVYMHEFMPTNTDIYNWYMAGTTEEERQNDINLITAFRQAMIE